MLPSKLERIVKEAIFSVLPFVFATVVAASDRDNLVNVMPDLKRVYVTSQVDSSTASTESKNVRADQKVNLYAVIEAELNGDRVYFGTIDRARIDDKVIYPKRWDKAYGDIDLTWFKVEAEKSNYGEDERIRYEEAEQEWNGWSHEADVFPLRRTENRVDGLNEFTNLGTMRFKISVDYDGSISSTPGKESTDELGIRDDVHRISVRRDDTELGWATAWCNLPYVWGSRSTQDQHPPMNHQTERFIAQDCADLVVGAARFAGRRDLEYTWSYGLLNKTDVVAEIFGMDNNFNFVNQNGEIIRYGNEKGEIRVGDKLLGMRHVGILARDLGPEGKADGVLNGYDVMFHTLFEFPREVFLAERPPVKVIRWK